MKHTLSPITIAAVVAGLALEGGRRSVRRSGRRPAEIGPGTLRAARRVRTKLREALKAERQKENVFRLDPAKRQEIVKPILDEAVKQGKLPAKARDRVLDHLGKQRP
jgi:hypothetical protein